MSSRLTWYRHTQAACFVLIFFGLAIVSPSFWFSYCCQEWRSTRLASFSTGKGTPSGRFQVLTAASMRMAVFWVVARCSLVEVCFQTSTRLHGATTQKTSHFRNTVNSESQDTKASRKPQHLSQGCSHFILVRVYGLLTFSLSDPSSVRRALVSGRWTLRFVLIVEEPAHVRRTSGVRKVSGLDPGTDC
jgi:hypothetical protein